MVEIEDAFLLPHHPLDVKPAGNAYTAQRKLENPLQNLPDEVVISILELLDPPTLLSLGQVCKAFFAFSRVDDLWKASCIE